MNIVNPIIPQKQIFYNTETNKIVPWKYNLSNKLDYKSIAEFMAIGFFLGNNTYYETIKTCSPAKTYYLNNDQTIDRVESMWDWYYKPNQLTFNQNLDLFIDVFDKIINTQTKDKDILLPLSGGLDSRTLFASVRNRSNLKLCSYMFENGINEVEYAKILSEKYNLPFLSEVIKKGYLWEEFDDLVRLNQCFTDFTHPRQAQVANKWKDISSTILLGHWGDVLFNSQIDNKKYSYDEQLLILKNKIIKSDGLELASELWCNWGLQGSFESYLMDEIDQLYKKIDILNTSARIRAFKSLYWAPRWTSINLSIFKTMGNLVLPYYDDNMCKLVCTIPEEYLNSRKIQIEYIKKTSPQIARVAWQKYHPFNLNNYQMFFNPIYLPVRLMKKIKRLTKSVFDDSYIITRNWENQFLGKTNRALLKNKLLSNIGLDDILNKNLIKKYLSKFDKYPIKYSHSIGMLLTLSTFLNNRHNN
tara:strand:- start:391 stop:1809 length:1419 start_codon:yes stop_codon:yes gene_type:complete